MSYRLVTDSFASDKGVGDVGAAGEPVQLGTALRVMGVCMHAR
jgi:hypothetical protein